MGMLGSGKAAVKAKDRLMLLADALTENVSGYDAVVDAATEFRESLAGDEVSLSMAEKLQVLKSLTHAKIRALQFGRQDGYRAFRMLDSISGDLVQLL
jgi:hypothetical protein